MCSADGGGKTVITLNLEKQGESITFLAEADSTAPRVENEVRLVPGAVGPTPHCHTKQREFFHVVAGSMIVTVEGKTHRVATGETLVVKPVQDLVFGALAWIAERVGRTRDIEPKHGASPGVGKRDHT
jgi:hypothetical protein